MKNSKLRHTASQSQKHSLLPMQIHLLEHTDLELQHTPKPLCMNRMIPSIVCQHFTAEPYNILLTVR